MMQKHVYVSGEDKKRADALLVKLECEHPNTFPKGWHEITPLQFAKSPFRIYSPEFDEYRQMHPARNEKRQDFLTYNPNRKVWEPIVLCANLHYFNDGTGYATVVDYYNEERPVRYFSFGCEHSYREMGGDECRQRGVYHGGRCYHVYECVKCHHIESQDSSD